MLKKISKIIYQLFTLYILVFIFCSLLFSHSCFAVSKLALTSKEADVFAQDKILFYEPFSDCAGEGGTVSGSCFKIDNSTEASDFWYAEGCLENGTCTRGTYASVKYTNSYNDFLLGDTETDEKFGGMQYIYAENYDIEFNVYENWIAKFTKKSDANSTRKYYWIVLPDEAYATGFGERYVATFENLDEPVYFITYDTHQCKHQNADYCDRAKKNPNDVAIGDEFFGALTKNGGSPSEVAKITGKLKSFCRIKGRGDILVTEGNGNVAASSKDDSEEQDGVDDDSENDSDNKGWSGGYPQYLQCDSRWGSKNYGGENTMCMASCGASSMAMLATVATGKEIFPDNIADDLGNSYYYETTGSGMVALDKKIGDKYGFEVIEVKYTSYDDVEEKMNSYLDDGYMLHFSGAGNPPFSSGGHYIGIFGKNGDKVMVANSGGGSVGKNEEMDLHDVVHAGIHLNSAFSAIRGINSGGSNNSDVCNNKSNSSSTGRSVAVGEAANIELNKRMEWLFQDGVPESSEEMKKYLKQVEAPIIDESGKETTMKLTVHEKLAEEIKAIFEEMKGVKNFRVKNSSTYGYSWRLMASGTGKLSHHSYGASIDLNSGDNPASYTGGTYNPGGNYYSVTDEIVSIWKKHGFYWGGDWSGYFRDYMHFTYTDH